MKMRYMIKMKMVRTAAVALCSAGLIVGVAMAQQDGPPPSSDGQQQGSPFGGHRGWSSERRAEMLQHHLNLTQDQTAQVKTFLEDERSKMEALHANTSLAPPDRHAQGEALHQDTSSKIRAVLTPDQKTKFDEMEARQREHRHGGPDGQTPPPQQ